MAKAKDIDEYIANFPEAQQERLTEIRKTLHALQDGMVETISYDIPTLKYLGKPVLYFAGFKAHTGMYPTPGGPAALLEEIKKYKHGRGTLRFPLDEALPLALIKKVGKARLQEVRKAAKAQ